MVDDEINWSLLEVTQDAQERAAATIAVAVHLQAMHAIRLVVVDGVAPTVVARKCGFDVDAAPPARGFVWGGDDREDDTAVDLGTFFGFAPRQAKPTGMAAFSAWLQGELKKAIEDRA